MYTAEEIEIANKTSRGLGNVGFRALVPRYIKENAVKTATILDFGAGKDAIHTKNLKAEGFGVTAHEFGNNVNENHDAHALDRKYDIVYASNVLNVQSSADMLNNTLKTVASVMYKSCSFFVCNYPMNPRKMPEMTANDLQTILETFFYVVEQVGGTKQSPVFCCSGTK